MGVQSSGVIYYINGYTRCYTLYLNLGMYLNNHHLAYRYIQWNLVPLHRDSWKYWSATCLNHTTDVPWRSMHSTRTFPPVVVPIFTDFFPHTFISKWGY